MKNLLPIFFLLLPFIAPAQYLDGIGTKWSDEFTEWNIYTIDENDEVVIGELRMRWQTDLDWSQWDFRLGELSGSIERVFKNDPTQWDVRVGNELVTIRTKWANDFSEWRITNNTKALNFESRYKNDFNKWECNNSTYGNFVVYTEYENDPREWLVIDELDEEIPFAMKLAMLFIATYNSYPKR